MKACKAACINGQVLVCNLGMHSRPSVSCNSSPCSELVPSCLLNVCCPAHGSQTNPVGHACSLCRLCPMTLALSIARSLRLHASFRVWASRCMSESAVLPRLSATQNRAWPCHPVTQTQNPCPLLQYSTCMIDAISSECIQNARVLRCARLAIPSPTLAVCVDFSHA